MTELTTSAKHVRTIVSTMPATLIPRTPSEVWTATKVLRRLRQLTGRTFSCRAILPADAYRPR